MMTALSTATSLEPPILERLTVLLKVTVLEADHSADKIFRQSAVQVEQGSFQPGQVHYRLAPLAQLGLGKPS